MWCGGHLHSVLDWTWLRPLYRNFRDLEGGCGDPFILLLPRKSLKYKFLPLALKSPPTHLEWVASFLSLSLPLE